MSGIRNLAVRGGALGDFLVTLPSLRALQQRWPDAELHLLTRPAYGRLAMRTGFAAGWRSLEDAAAATLFSRGTSISPEWCSWLGTFDHVVSWVPDPDGAFAFQVSRCGAQCFVQGPSRVTGPGPASLCLASLPPPHTLKPENPVCLLETYCRTPQPGAIALHPGSGSHSKNWPFGSWLSVLTAWRNHNRFKQLNLLTGEGEEDALAGMLGALDAAGIPFTSVHRQPLDAVAAVLGGCQLFLGHDSGISHLAAACGVPCRLLFGPTNPAVWAPPAPDVRVLRAPEGDLASLTVSEVTAWLCS